MKEDQQKNDDSLYCDTDFIAVVWSQTHNICVVRLCLSRMMEPQMCPGLILPTSVMGGGNEEFRESVLRAGIQACTHQNPLRDESIVFAGFVNSHSHFAPPGKSCLKQSTSPDMLTPSSLSPCSVGFSRAWLPSDSPVLQFSLDSHAIILL